jgi:hypothetical protein
MSIMQNITHTHTHTHTRTHTYYLYIKYAGHWYTSSRVQTRPKPSDFSGRKILSMLFFGGEVKLPVSCRRFGQHSRPKFHLSLLGALALLGTWRHLAAKVGTSKGMGKQWKTTSKNLPRMHRVRAMPVAWIGSGSCQNRLKGSIPINQSVQHWMHLGST